MPPTPLPPHRHQWMNPETRQSLNRPPTVTVQQLVVVKFFRGEGCCQQDLVREVTAIFDATGKLIAENDPFIPDPMAEAIPVPPPAPPQPQPPAGVREPSRPRPPVPTAAAEAPEPVSVWTEAPVTVIPEPVSAPVAS